MPGTWEELDKYVQACCYYYLPPCETSIIMLMLWMRGLSLRGVRPLVQEQTAGKWQSYIVLGPPGTLVGGAEPASGEHGKLRTRDRGCLKAWGGGGSVAYPSTGGGSD